MRRLGHRLQWSFYAKVCPTGSLGAGGWGWVFREGWACHSGGHSSCGVYERECSSHALARGPVWTPSGEVVMWWVEGITQPASPDLQTLCSRVRTPASGGAGALQAGGSPRGQADVPRRD